MNEIARKWPADAVERRSVASLVPYARNARTHSESQVDAIAASIREWGWTSPVLIDEAGMIIAGHGRVMAAQCLGIGDVPVMVATGWSEDQKRAYVLADNQIALGAGWDDDLLRVELGDLASAGFDLSLLAFPNLEALLADKTAGLTDPDEVPEAPSTPVSRLGDVWQLGNHRIICGDSADAETVARLLGSVRPHLMVTDPPYGVEYDADWRNKAARKSTSMGNRALGAGAVGKVKNDDRADWSPAWELFPGDVAYVWHAGRHAATVQSSMETAGFEIRCQIIWAKNAFAIGRGDYHWQHEPCWYAVRKGRTGSWTGDRKQTTLWSISKPQKSETGHSTQKPVECMKRPIENNSSHGQAVYEPFSGSGTTIIAGEMTGRHIYAIELHPPYVDVAVKRWQDFTGRDAVLDGDGRTFAQIGAERAKEAA
jgi:DNA modification methylase